MSHIGHVGRTGPNAGYRKLPAGPFARNLNQRVAQPGGKPPNR